MLFLKNGWPNKTTISNELKTYYPKRDELTIEQDCIMWGYRIIIIPNKLRDIILKELHTSHAGIVKMKTTARSFFWWPNINQHIENLGRTCCDCIEAEDNPAKNEVNPWKWPEKPWQRIHTDFIGPLNGYNFLLMIDAKTK